MKITIFVNNERVHDWYIGTVNDPNSLDFMISNCGHVPIRYSVENIRRMENEIDRLKWESFTLSDEVDELTTSLGNQLTQPPVAVKMPLYKRIFGG